MEYVHIQCASGHRLKAGIHLRGKTLACPKCRTPVVIPQANDALSDTGLMRILGDVAPLPAPRTMAKTSTVKPRSCPRCGLEVSQDRSVCRHCNCFVGTGNNTDASNLAH